MSDSPLEADGHETTGEPARASGDVASAEAVPTAVEHLAAGPADEVVSTALLSSVLFEFADDVRAVEDELADEIPGGPPQGIHRSLERVGHELASGARTMRTHPAINAVARVTDEPVRAGLLRAMMALDAKVNAVDDVIDTRTLDREERTHLMTVIGFSDLSMLEELPPEHVAEVARILRRYSVELAQIPVVEHRLRARLRTATTRQDRLEGATAIYGYRARDMKAFAEIPAVVAGVSPRVVDRLVADLCAFRARFLLFEDFRHVERDLAADHESPIMVLAGAGATPADLESVVRALLSEFAYTSWADGRYRAVLEALERRPDDVAAVVDRTVRRLAG